MIYLVAFTGGYETPSYFGTDDQNEAVAKAEEWAEDAREENGDTIAILTLDSKGFVTRTVYVFPGGQTEGR